MKTKLLCITMLIFTVLIFGGNHYAARNEFQENFAKQVHARYSLAIERK